MQAIEGPDRQVVGRKDNVVIVNFRGPEPPAPYFPGAGAMRATVVACDELLDASSEPHNIQQQRFIA
jgi:hypothetical protein